MDGLPSDKNTPRIVARITNERKNVANESADSNPKNNFVEPGQLGNQLDNHVWSAQAGIIRHKLGVTTIKSAAKRPKPLRVGKRILADVLGLRKTAARINNVTAVPANTSSGRKHLRLARFDTVSSLLVSSA
jgi:hypothetical protein